MIPTQATNGPATPSTQSGPLPPAGKNRSVLSSDFETFLKMLTAQARYQDPLEPIDSTEYAAQLAQFSMVEQQVKTNETLTSLTDRLGGSDLSALAGLVGLDARVPGPVTFDGAPVSLAVAEKPGAQRADLVVTDGAGAEVQRLPLPPGKNEVVWSGLKADGTLFPFDEYQLFVESFSGDVPIARDPAQSYGRVTEAQISEGQVVLVLRGGRTVQAASVTALRKPG